MGRVNLKTRIRRNQLDVLAGENYRDENSEIVSYLNISNNEALLGIQREDGIYTIFAKENIYYSTVSGVEGNIPHKAFLDILKRNALNLGKTGRFEFVKVNETGSIWVFNGKTMNALWNTILLLVEAG